MECEKVAVAVSEEGHGMNVQRLECSQHLRMIRNENASEIWSGKVTGTEICCKLDEEHPGYPEKR
jgi:hypothetical protein